MSTFDVPIGWAGGTALTNIDQVRAEATYAVEAGFDSFWVSQIFGVDPIVALASVATIVEPLAEVGTSVVPLYGRHLLALASQARTAQAVLGGRFTLGIGPSHAMVVEGFFGESYDRPFSHSAEFIAAINPLLRGEPTDLEGRELTAKGWLTIDADPVPVLLAALGPRMLELAGAHTLGTTLGPGLGPKTIANHIAPTINAAADPGGPPPRVQALVAVCITDDPAAAIEHSRSINTMYAQLPAYRAMLDREGLDSPADLLVAGSIDDIVTGINLYIEAGATDIRLGIGAPDHEIYQQTRTEIAALLGS
ncbi:MAG: TIGR03564 family F420-dependent LLM class oxidoreductase [Acidimicrobiales bacterium]